MLLHKMSYINQEFCHDSEYLNAEKNYLCYYSGKSILGTMQANELKYNLIDKLISVRDLNLLQKINDLIGNVDINKTVFKVSDAQRNMLMASEEDIQKGNFISDDELNAEEDQWLNG